jgi:nicotinamidase-related amidase
MRQALLIIDVQPSFTPPPWLVANIEKLLPLMPSVATVERHDEAKVPFMGQLNWAPGLADDCLVKADRVFIKYGYAPTPETIAYLRDLKAERILVCGIQADTCVLAAGFALFDAGLRPTLIADLTIGSSLDRSGALGVSLWRHHFGKVIESHIEIIAEIIANSS